MPQPDEADRLTPAHQPPITEAMRDSARANPNSWLYVIDEAYDPDDDVPSWAVVGAYPVDPDGEIVERFRPNDEYRPSPQALGYEEPEGELEDLMQLVHTGHASADELPEAVLGATLYVYAVSPTQNTVTGFFDKAGRLVVPAYTRRSKIPPEWPGARVLTGRQLLPHIAGYPIAVNPSEPVTARVTAEDLADAARGD